MKSGGLFKSILKEQKIAVQKTKFTNDLVINKRFVNPKEKITYKQKPKGGPKVRLKKAKIGRMFKWNLNIYLFF